TVPVADNARAEAGADLRAFTLPGSEVVEKANASIERTVVHDHVYVGGSSRLRGAVVGRASDLRSNVHLDEGVVIGNDTFIGDGVSVYPQVKIYPFKSVEAGAAVTSSIVWETRDARALFGRQSVRGLANVDITSEVAVRLALAYGSSLPKGSVVTTSRDTSRTARALKRTIIAGLNLSG